MRRRAGGRKGRAWAWTGAVGLGTLLLLTFLLRPFAAPPAPPCPVLPGSPPPALAPPVARAVALARAVESSPAAPGPALRVHGATLAELEALLYDVAVDPAWAQAYAEARGR